MPCRQWIPRGDVSRPRPTKAIAVYAAAFPEARHRNGFSDPFLGWRPTLDAPRQSRDADPSVASVPREVTMVKKDAAMAFDDRTELKLFH